MKSIRINNLNKNSSMHKPSVINKPITEVLVKPVFEHSSLTISVFQLWQLILLFLLLSFFLSIVFLSPPPLCSYKATKGSILSFHSRSLHGGSGVVYMGGAGPMKVDLHLFKHPYFGYLKGEGGSYTISEELTPDPEACCPSVTENKQRGWTERR